MALSRRDDGGSPVTPMRVVVTDQVFPDVHAERAILREAGIDLEVANGDRAEILDRCRTADGLLNAYLTIDAEFINELDRCRIIARYGIGVDNIDIAAAAAAGIVVTNVPDYCVEEVATHAVALILSQLRRIHEGDAAVRRGEWGLAAVRPIQRLSETIVGLIGYGRIGRRVADAMRTLGAPLKIFDPYLVGSSSGLPDNETADLASVISACSVISLHVPLTDTTRNIVSEEAISRMRKDAIVVNTSRGALVDVSALVTAIRKGAIHGAALDVFPTEPLDLAIIEDTPNLIVTPHMAYYSEAAIRESQRKAAEQVAKVLSGGEADYRVA